MMPQYTIGRVVLVGKLASERADRHRKSLAALALLSAWHLLSIKAARQQGQPQPPSHYGCWSSPRNLAAPSIRMTHSAVCFIISSSISRYGSLLEEGDSLVARSVPDITLGSLAADSILSIADIKAARYSGLSFC